MWDEPGFWYFAAAIAIAIFVLLYVMAFGDEAAEPLRSSDDI